MAERTRESYHVNDDVRADVARTTGDVGDHDSSTTAYATERAIRGKGRITLCTGLRGGDATIWNLGKIASVILQ